MTDRLPDGTRWSGGLGALAFAGGLAAVVGATGLVGGVGVALAWLALSDLAAYALGHVVLAAVLPAGDGTALLPASALLLAVALVPLLLGPTGDADRRRSLAVATVLVAGVLAAIALAPIAMGEAVWLGAATLLVAAAMASYALHRYALLASGVLADG